NLIIPQITETKEEEQYTSDNNPSETHDENTNDNNIPLNSDDPLNSAPNNLNLNLMNILSPVVNDLDERITSVHLSQTQLNLILNQLLTNLKEFETSITPPLIQPSIDKLIKAKSRLNSINHTLLVVMDRLDKMQVAMSQQGK
ncbi:hypothetical protein CONCODRAFT_76971, partial [Conidiobolus coronatus NRRL 28638]